jgi:hypothetical protein
MKHTILISILFFTAVAMAESKTLKCDVSYKFKDAAGKVQTEDHPVEGPLSEETGPLGISSTQLNVTTNDGRVTVECFAIQDVRNPQIIKSSVLVFDAKSKTGAQAGDMALALPASPRSDINYSLDMQNATDYSVDNLVTAHCDVL